ncbi:hypothetical protein CDAR_591181 [Caerostris darwini]|uniref:Uncharacterized protein n=1 Tax=Caerostris darwini TaxID=1538125 RepID=A0AAV4RKQ9_9ARAC|nr:hypothetical protein CDAR_591181 [Caerostris darwini]
MARSKFWEREVHFTDSYCLERSSSEKDVERVCAPIPSEPSVTLEVLFQQHIYIKNRLEGTLGKMVRYLHHPLHIMDSKNS